MNKVIKIFLVIVLIALTAIVLFGATLFTGLLFIILKQLLPAIVAGIVIGILGLCSCKLVQKLRNNHE